MWYKTIILLLCVCYFIPKSKAQGYFNNRYDTFGSCDGTNGIDTMYNGYISAEVTCSTSSYYTFLLGLYNLDGTLRKNKAYIRPNMNFLPNSGKYIRANNNTFLVSGTRTYKPDTTLCFLWRFNSNLDSVAYFEYGFLNKTNVITSFVKSGKYIYMVGYTDSLTTNNDILLIKTDTSGNELWKKKIGITGWDEAALSIDTLNEKLIIAGNKYPHNTSGTNGFVMYLDTAGNTIWQKTVITNGGYGGCIAKRLKDGNVLIFSRIKKYSVGSNDFYKLQCEKIDINNNTIWSKEYFPLGESNPYSAIENNDGNIIICGQRAFTDNTLSGTVYEINQSGDSLHYREYRILAHSQNYFRDVVQAPDNGYCFAGFVTPMNGDGGTQDIWLLKVDSNLFCESATACITGINSFSQKDQGMKLYPNPASNELYFLLEQENVSTITVDIFDVQGHQMIHSVLTNSTEPHKFDVKAFADGVYFYRVKAGNNYLKTGKVVIINN